MSVPIFTIKSENLNEVAEVLYKEKIEFRQFSSPAGEVIRVMATEESLLKTLNQINCEITKVVFPL